MRASLFALTLACGLAGSGVCSAAGSGIGVFTSIDAGYANLGGGGLEGHDITAAGSVLVGGHHGLQAQLSAGYDDISASGSSANSWSAGGDLLWRGHHGTIGASVSYSSLDNGFWPSANFESYGAFGQWYLGRAITLELKGGGFSFGNGDSGSYASAGAVYYPWSAFSLSLTGGYASFQGSRGASLGVNGEYMLSQFPLSIVAGYDYSDAGGGGGSSNTILIALKFRTGDPGKARDLESFDRNGTLTWNGALAPAALL